MADGKALEREAGELLHSRGLTLAVAESCTGGLLGGRLTARSGSSMYFRGGVIAYANDVKQRALGVSAESLRRHGAVSGAVAREMAEGVRRRLGADWGVSITGVAGPTGGSSRKPVGLVFIGVAGPLKTVVRRHRFAGSRSAVRREAAVAALAQLKDELKKH